MGRAGRVVICAVAMVALSALPAGGALAKPSGPGPGNSPNAKACQKGGWENLVREDGSSFANEDECVSHAAQGGELEPEPRGTVTAVRGSAFGYFSDVSLFGGPSDTRGPDPSVTLASDASNSPASATAPSGSVAYGPATFFTSGPLDVGSQGALGPTGSVTSSASAENINTSGTEPFTATSLTSNCTASGAGVSGATTVIDGTLQTSEGDPDVTGDETIINIPTNPAPNTAYQGQFESVGDSFEYVFNEQILNPDGSIQVTGAHLRLLGPTAVGDVYIGRSVCGVTSSDGS